MATLNVYTLSLHDALPISRRTSRSAARTCAATSSARWTPAPSMVSRSEEHTSELQSRPHFVCRLLLEKKKKPHNQIADYTQPASHQSESRDPTVYSALTTH